MRRKRQDSDLPPLTCSGCEYFEFAPQKIGEFWIAGECLCDLAPRGLTTGAICRNYQYRWTYENADPGDRDFAELVEEVAEEIRREKRC